MLLMESSFKLIFVIGLVIFTLEVLLVLKCHIIMKRLLFREPLIEPIETSKGHRSWELMMEISKEHDTLELSPEEEEPDEIVFEPPQMSIHVVAQDVLELTVSRHAWMYLQILGRLFKKQ
ncbi:vacuolar protein sorting-associated protein 13 [Caerostris extrusa]|uniref:Vacuolar protein sorting-associated protein 13 n=1 Tax=Caerostris extrusa TaxID=172846 RepID=A0AAV4MNX8_CAEEX|nr:vacuolar protein sorting-associated protein 13 [Caerostris extrusa]